MLYIFFTFVFHGISGKKIVALFVNLGLQMEVSLNQSDYLPISQMAGIRIVISSPNETAMPEELGIILPAGYMTAIAIEQVD